MRNRDFKECTQCGLCCRLAGRTAYAVFLPINEDGSCGHLDPQGGCKVYHARPEFCRIDRLKPKGWTWRRYWKLNAALCNRMQEKLGYPKRLRVRVKR